MDRGDAGHLEYQLGVRGFYILRSQHTWLTVITRSATATPPFRMLTAGPLTEAQLGNSQDSGSYLRHVTAGHVTPHQQGHITMCHVTQIQKGDVKMCHVTETKKVTPQGVMSPKFKLVTLISSDADEVNLSVINEVNLSAIEPASLELGLDLSEFELG